MDEGKLGLSDIEALKHELQATQDAFRIREEAWAARALRDNKILQETHDKASARIRELEGSLRDAEEENERLRESLERGCRIARELGETLGRIESGRD